MRFLQMIGGARIFALVLIWSLQSPIPAQELLRPSAQGEHHPRYSFSLLLKSVEFGMSKDEVSRVVGKPDSVFKVPPIGKREPIFKATGASSTRSDGQVPVAEIWGYGSKDPSALPQHGRVCFGADGRVQHVVGATAPSAEVLRIEESELQTLLTAVYHLPPMNNMCGGDYDPALVIQIVNGLQRLGKEGAQAVIAEFLRLIDCDCEGPLRETGFALIMPLLFELRQEDDSRSTVAGSPARTQVHSPYYPFMFVDGIPFMVVVSGGHGGQPDSAKRCFERLCREYQFRETPIVPTGDAESIHANLESKMLAWFRREPDWLTMHIGRQVILLHKAALAEEEQKFVNENIYMINTKIDQMLKQVFDAKLHWNHRTSHYEM